MAGMTTINVGELADELARDLAGQEERPETTQVIHVQWWLGPMEKRYKPACKSCGWKGWAVLSLGLAQRACQVHRQEKGCPR